MRNYFLGNRVRVYFIFFLSLTNSSLFVNSVSAKENSTILVDSLTDQLGKVKGEEKIDLLHQLGYEFFDIDLDSSIYFYQLGLEEAELIHDTLSQIQTLIELGYSYSNTYNASKSKEYLDRATQLSKKANIYSELYRCYTELGNFYYQLNLYDSALFYHQESLKVKERLGNTSRLFSSLNNIGLIYYKLKDFENAILYFDKALDIKLSDGDSSSVVTVFNNLGLSYTSAMQFKLAEKNLLLALKFVDKNDEISLSYIYDGLGNLYIRMNSLNLARKYLILSLELSQKTGDEYLEAYNHFHLAKIEFQNQNYGVAKDHLKMSNKLATELEDNQINLFVYNLYAAIYDDQQIYDSAFYYQKLATEAGDQIFNEGLAKNVATIQLLVQKEESQQVIAQKEQDINQRKKLNQLLVIVLILSILLIIIVTRNYINTNKINKKLSVSNYKIEKQKEVLESRNKQLAEAQHTIKHQNDLLKNVNSELEIAVRARTKELAYTNVKLEKAVKDLDDFIYKTSHDLRGPIATMQGIIKIGQMESKDNDTLKYFDTLQNISDRANKILIKLIEVHEMYQRPANLEVIDIEKSVKAGMDLAGKAELAKGIKVNYSLKKRGTWNSDRALFITIIENMINNAYLFSINKEAFVNLTVQNGSEDSLKLIFEDNGFGIMDSDINKVFEVFFKGSPRRNGTGLEIYAARIAVEKLKGRIELKRPKDNTTFEITLPTI